MFVKVATVVLVYFCGFFSGCTATSTLKIKNFSVQRNHPNSDSSVFFSFGAEPYISPSSTTVATYEVILHWTEEVFDRWGTGKVTRYATRCSAGNFRTDGSSYSFSVSKYTLGSGPLTVYISVSLGCTQSYYYPSYCGSYCGRGTWGYRGTSDSITIDSVKGSFAPFEVDFELWAGEKCNEFVMSTNNISSALLPVIKDTCTCPVSNTTFYKLRYMCVHDDFVTVRGIIGRRNDSMATTLRTWLQTALTTPRKVLLGKRVMTLKASPCGVSIAAIDAPYCGKGNPPDTPSKTWYGDVVIQANNKSSDPPTAAADTSGQPAAALIAAIVITSVGSIVSVVAVVVLVAYIGFTKCKARKYYTARYGDIDSGSQEDNARLTFAED
jgi:hypothetical protein